ncbi:MAG: MGH1-like glycoside hydrolase domain-containing protein [Limisphaerales bacterium]
MKNSICKITPGRLFVAIGGALCCFMVCGLAADAQPEDKTPAGVTPEAGEASPSGGTKAAGEPERRIRDDAAPGKGDRLRFMENQATFLVKDFKGDEHQRPEMGCELSDFGSWYDVAYSGGINRFWMNSVRHHTYDQVGFNAANDVGMLALFLQTPSGELIDGSRGGCVVNWYPYGWKTTTRQDGIEIESTTFFTAFNTVVILAQVKNAGTEAATLTPSLLVTGRSEYDGKTGGLIAGYAAHGRLAWRNQRVGKSADPKDYTDSILIGSTLGALHPVFLPRYLASGQGNELKEALRETWASALKARTGSAVASTGPLKLAAGETRELAFYVAAGADDAAAEKTAVRAGHDLAATGLAGIVSRLERDWNDYLGALPKLQNPSDEDLKLYYSAALALRANHLILRLPAGNLAGLSNGAGPPVDATGTAGQNAVLYDASCPARGGFNLFFQSDACWNLLGYLDINPDWAAGHAVPILDPPSIIMDPHYYWSMWELYSRLPDPKKQQAFAAMVYPLLKENYRVWTTQIDIDHNLLCSTPNNWDDNPRADLLFKEATDIPGQWNSWWRDWVNGSRDNFLEDPAASSQLAYGTVIMGRFARILGKNQEAADWEKQFQKHVQAIDTLWDEEKGYWIVTYRHALKDKVLTSSILYPVFTDVCRDPARIRRVIESHILNPAEFNGPYPVPTVAYNDPRYYKQKPPRTDQEGGLWRGNIWLPEAWIIVKGLYKYGYEAEATDMAHRLTGMMSHQAQWSKSNPQFACVPAEFYDSRTGQAQNIRRFSWTSAVAMDFLLGNYQNERVLGTNPERDRAINGHLREVFDFESGKSLFRVKTVKSVFPLLRMASADSLPINQSAKVEFSFSDPAGNFAGSTIAFSADPGRWSVMEKAKGVPLKPDAGGYYHAALGAELVLIPRN